MPEIALISKEQALIDVLEKRFTREGYQIEIAKKGKQGLELIRNNTPDLALVDVEMPDMSGFEILKKLNDTQLNNVPVVAIFNSGDPEEIEKATNLGIEDWIIKTEFDPEEVINKVEKQLN